MIQNFMFILVLITEQRYKFESNSQHTSDVFHQKHRCLLQSKDTNLKAIHNTFEEKEMGCNWCLLQSKDTNLKAIHNYAVTSISLVAGAYYRAKIQI